jgi:hypothetical protein
VLHGGLSVIEARWWENGNNSVRPLFETLAGIVEGNPHAVRYDMFVEETSLSAIIADVATKCVCHSIYIGSHGNDGAISGLGNAEISRTRLRNMFRNANANEAVAGLYFGSCLIANRQNAMFWLTEAPSTGLKWIAGYTKSVDWVDSSAVDMIFWSKLLNEHKTNRSRRRNKRSDLDMVKHASNEMKKLMPTVFNELGFNVYHLDTGGTLTSVW